MSFTAPIIGITSPCELTGQNTINKQYAQYIANAGGIPLIFPLIETLHKDASLLDMHVNAYLERIDGLLLTGGGDIDANSFGGSVYESYSHAELVDTCPVRDTFEGALCKRAYEQNLPILGICRGMQLLNIAQAGRMVRDLSEQPGLSASAKHHNVEPYDKPAHHVTLEASSKLAQIFGTTQLAVNSHHHQAVSTPGCGIRFVGWADDKTPEALEVDDKPFVIGVQWHPEVLGTQPQLFEAFVNAARERSRRT